MDRSTKEAVVDELKDKLAKIASIVVADYRGIDVPTVTNLRNEFRKAQCEYKIYKNTLVKRAIQGTRMAPLGKFLEGPTAFMFSFESPSAAAKVATKFAAENTKFKLKAAYFDGTVMEGQEIATLAAMPGKDEMRATLLATLLAPAQNLLRTLGAGSTNFVYLLDAQKRKLEGGEEKQA